MKQTDNKHQRELRKVLIDNQYRYLRFGSILLFITAIIYTIVILLTPEARYRGICFGIIYFNAFLVIGLVFVIGRVLANNRQREIAVNIISLTTGLAFGITFTHFFSHVNNMIIMVGFVASAMLIAAACSCLAPSRYAFILLDVSWTFPPIIYAFFFSDTLYFKLLASLTLVYAITLIFIHYIDYSRRVALIKKQFSLMDKKKMLSDALDEIEAAMEELEAMNDNLIEANRELEESRNRHARDMAMAANVQSAFLYKEPPVTEEYDIAFEFKPMSGVSGDFYDFYTNNGSVKGLGLFDVSGHGISSALFTLIAKSIIFKHVRDRGNENIRKLMSLINRELINEIGPSTYFLTGILLRFIGGRIEYVNGGHPDMMYRVFKSKKVGELLNRDGESVRGPYLAIDLMDVPFRSLTIELKSGDCLFLYTDCLVESTDDEDRCYDEGRVMKSLREAPNGSAREILDHILSDFYGFIKDFNRLKDDLTLILVKKL